MQVAFSLPQRLMSKFSITRWTGITKCIDEFLTQSTAIRSALAAEEININELLNRKIFTMLRIYF